MCEECGWLAAARGWCCGPLGASLPEQHNQTRRLPSAGQVTSPQAPACTCVPPSALAVLAFRSWLFGPPPPRPLGGPPALWSCVFSAVPGFCCPPTGAGAPRGQRPPPWPGQSPAEAQPHLRPLVPRLGRWAVGTGPPGNGPPPLSPVTSPGLCSPCPSASWGVPATLFLLPLPGQGARQWLGREPLGPASGAWKPTLPLGPGSPR